MDTSDASSLAERLIDLHLPGGGWGFAFDRAVRRAGACDYVQHRITMSRHLVLRAEEPEVRQVLLHEIAHAQVGHAAAHGPRWRAAAARIGYTGSRLHDRQIADERAPWIGRCPAGHEHRRFRRPNRPTSCGVCSRRFTRAALITWRRAEPGRDEGRTAEAARPSSERSEVNR